MFWELELVHAHNPVGPLALVEFWKALLSEQQFFSSRAEVVFLFLWQVPHLTEFSLCLLMPLEGTQIGHGNFLTMEGLEYWCLSFLLDQIAKQFLLYFSMDVVFCHLSPDGFQNLSAEFPFISGEQGDQTFLGSEVVFLKGSLEYGNLILPASVPMGYLWVRDQDSKHFMSS